MSKNKNIVWLKFDLSKESETMVYIMAETMIREYHTDEIESVYYDPSTTWGTTGNYAFSDDEKSVLLQKGMRYPEKDGAKDDVSELSVDDVHKENIRKAVKILRSNRRTIDFCVFGDIIHLCDSFSPIGGETEKELDRLNVRWREQSETYTYYLD